MSEKVTPLKLIGFSTEVEEGPVELLLQTDRGAFNLEIPQEQLSKLVYALRFIEYAQEPLRKNRLQRQSARVGLAAKSPSKKSKGK
jgi:hypothetical protein